MATNYFAPIQNAMAQSGQNALTINQINRQRAQDERQNMMDQRQMAAQDEASQMRRLQILGPLAVHLKQLPPEQLAQEYPAIAQRLRTIMPDLQVPDTFDQNTMQNIDSVAQIWQSMQGPQEQPQLKGDAANLAVILGRNPTIEELQEYRSKGASQTHISTGGKFGTIPPGYVLKQAPDGGYTMEPVPDGPAAKDAEKEKTAAEMKKFSVDEKKNLVLNKVDEALDSVGLFSTGFLGQISKGLGGSPAYDLSSTVNTIQANLGFDKLQAMRDASPTGGALGQVSERELALLTSAVSSLDIAQSKEQLVRNLKQIRDSYRRWAANQQQAMKSGAIKGPQEQNPATGTTANNQPTVQEGATATNPQTGQKIIFRNGKWENM